MNSEKLALENRLGEPARWSLRLFGDFELSVLPTGDRVAPPGKRERALLAYLALSPKGRQPRRKLAALFWGETSDQALDNLRTCLWRLRKALGDTDHHLLASDDEDIVLDTAAFDVDVLIFGRFAAHSGPTELDTAANLYSGGLLEGIELDSEEFKSWRRAEASRYLDKAVDVLSRLMNLLTACGETERAIETGARILRHEPLHEATTRHMMQLYAQSGRRGMATQLYRTLAKALKDDLNAQPESETRLIFSEIVRAGEDPSGAAASVDVAQPRRRAKVRPASDVPSGSAVPARPPFRVHIPAAFAGAALVAAGLGLYWQLAPVHVAATIRTQQPQSTADGTAPAQTIAIAVLPFTNLSGDASQQFFSDGMTEEISTALAKFRGLQLVARASAFRFRGEKGARSAGKALGARYVIQGTVRKAGNRVRITAQLTQTDNGANVWSESYERELTDVFVIQEDIATAISEALRMSLGLAPGAHLVSSRNIDPESYAEYLRARPLVRTRFTGVPHAIKILEPVVARNPNFAPASALLAYSYAMLPAFGSAYSGERRQRIEEFWPKAEVAARRAIQLDSSLADGYLPLAHLEMLRGRPVAAEDLISKALALDPNNPDALQLQVSLLANVGLLKKSLATAQRVRALEPYLPSWNQDTAEILWENEQYDTAITMLKSLVDRPSGPTSLAMAYASLGHYTDAANVLEAALKTRFSPQPGWKTQYRTAAALLREAPAKIALPQNPPRLERASFVYLYVGAPDHALDYYEDMAKSGLAGGQGIIFGYLWHPSYAPIRKTERFKALIRNAGIVDYWRQRGWPDLCRPLGANDFVCD